MRPTDQFSILNHGKISFDAESFVKLYLPIVGRDAFSLYHLMVQFTSGRISHFLEYLDLGPIPFEEALNKLSALHLVDVYNANGHFSFQLHSPLNLEDFLADPFYVQLLISRIGKSRVDAMMKEPEIKGVNVSRKFSDVYSVNLRGSAAPAEAGHQKAKKSTFDITVFSQMMERQKLTFQNENQDILTLYSLAEKYQSDWYQIFKIAEQTANVDRTLNLAAITRHYVGAAEPKAKASDFPEAFQALILSAKSATAEQFIRGLKNQVGGFVANDELKLIQSLKLRHFNDEVLNIMIHYVLLQQNNPTLSAQFVNRIANDWLRANVGTAEAAVKHILDFNDKKAKKISSKPKAKAESKKSAQIPDWHNENYQNQSTDAQLAEFNRRADEALKKLEGMK